MWRSSDQVDIVCLDTWSRSSCFDCAVCLSVFLDGDRLRLFPGCGHAFHLNCIDAWLLSNLTCPLCCTPVIFGMFRRSKADEEGRGCGLDGRRFCSMGSYQHVEGDLKMIVKLSPAARNPNGATGNVKFKAAGNEEDKRSDGGRPRAESFSMSKIWLWSRNSKLPP